MVLGVEWRTAASTSRAGSSPSPLQVRFVVRLPFRRCANDEASKDGKSEVDRRSEPRLPGGRSISIDANDMFGECVADLVVEVELRRRLSVGEEE